MSSHVLSEKRFDVYQTITDKIVGAIEAGAGEFVMPWHRLGPGLGRPTNATTQSRYQGVNVVALWAEAVSQGYTSGWWATFQQWEKLGAQVKRGEHSTTIVVYKPLPTDATEGEESGCARSRLFARAFRVFNSDQIEGWEPPSQPQLDLTARLDRTDAFVTASGAHIEHGGDFACYLRAEDRIHLPERRRFFGSPTCTPTEAYYSTLLHELTHWSGAEHRLNRELGSRFGEHAYAMEELVAELGSAFLCADLGVANEPRPDHAAYLASWLTVLKSDRRAIFTAAQRAKEAVAYLEGFTTKVHS